MASSNSPDHLGHISDKPYSVVRESADVLKHGILNHPITVPHLISGLDKYADSVSFEGSDNPSLPVNWRFAESIAALKGLESIYVNAILDKVYGIAPQKVLINTLVTYCLIYLGVIYNTNNNIAIMHYFLSCLLCFGLLIPKGVM